MKTTIGTNDIRREICYQATKGRVSAWSKGVAIYALDILHEIEEETGKYFLDVDKNGKIVLSCYTLSLMGNRFPFDTWRLYSRAGLSLIYDQDIAERLCTPSEYKRAEKNGFFRANSREDWLDVQGRALFQAAEMIKAAIRKELAA